MVRILFESGAGIGEVFETVPSLTDRGDGLGWTDETNATEAPRREGHPFSSDERGLDCNPSKCVGMGRGLAALADSKIMGLRVCNFAASCTSR